MQTTPSKMTTVQIYEKNIRKKKKPQKNKLICLRLDETFRRPYDVWIQQAYKRDTAWTFRDMCQTHKKLSIGYDITQYFAHFEVSVHRS